MIENPKKILFVRIGAIGDVMQTTEAYRAVKRAYPECVIHYLTGIIPSNLLSCDCDLDKVITVDNISSKNFFSLAKQLREEKYDVVVCLKSSLKLWLFTSLLGAKNVLHYNADTDLHIVYNYFQTVGEKIKGLEFKNELTLTVPDEVKSGVKLAVPTEKKFVVLSTEVGALCEGKKWRREYFRELAEKIVDKYDVSVILTGTAEERELLGNFEGLNEVCDLAGRFNILESAALYSFAEYVIAADSAPLYVAEAVKSPVCIGLYGASPVKRYGFSDEKNHSVISHNLGCIPCGKKFCKLRNGAYSPCMDGIKPDDIMKILEEDNILPLKQK